MHCAEYRDLLAAHADGLLTPEEAPLVDAHLAACAACAGLLDRQRDVRDLLHTRVRMQPTPAALQDRVLTSLEREHRVVRRDAHLARWWVRPLVRVVLGGALAAGLVAVLAPRWRGHSETPSLAIMRMVVEHYRAAEAQPARMDLRTDRVDELRQYYGQAGAFGFAETALDLRPMGYELVGGSVVTLAAHRSTMTVYRSGRGLLLCHRLDAFEMPLPAGAEIIDGLAFYTLDGITICIQHIGNMLCLMASDLPRAEFIAAMRHHA